METDFTKREYIALKAMQGIMSNPNRTSDYKILIKDSFWIADAFIKESKKQE